MMIFLGYNDLAEVDKDKVEEEVALVVEVEEETM